MPVVSEGEHDSGVGSGTTDSESVFVFPATAAQRRFWLLDQLIKNGNPALNMPIALRWGGPLEHPILQRALNEVMARHEALRTRFVSDGKQLQQLIAPTLKLDLPMVEATGSADAFLALIDVEARRPFDLRVGPLVRVKLISLAPNDFLVLLIVHHIVSDGWSNMILVRDLCAFYTAFLRQQTSPLPKLPLQFADYAEWQTARLAAGDFVPQRTYWRKQLAGTFPALALPFDRVEHGNPTAAAEIRSRILPLKLVHETKSLAASQGASPFMLYLAAFQLFLHRYTGEVDFLVTSPSANRERPELESLVGPFANPLLLRANLQGDPSFHDLVGRARTTALNAFSNQDFPFELLLDEFDGGKLQVNFQYEANNPESLDLPEGIKVEVLPAISTGTVYELSMSIVETRDGLRVDIEYKTSLFNASTIERMLDHYESLLRSVVAEPMKPGLAILRPGEKRHVVPNQARLISPGPPSLSDEKTNPKPLSQLVRPYLGLQLQLIAIWEDVLGVSGIGIRDNFFDLGGNSLLAIRMLQRAEAACAKVIPPSALFDQPTIEHLAGKMAREIIEESPTLLHVNDGGEQTPFFYLHGDLSGGGFYSLTLSGALGHDQPFYVLPPQDIRVLPVAPTIEEMATAHYDALRTVRPKGPYVIGGFCIGGLVAYELAQQIRAHGDEVEMLLIIDAAPERKVMRLLRSLASMLGALFHWDDDQKVRQFGRWAVWRRRFSQGIAENGDAPTRKESPPVYRGVNVLYEMFRNRFLFGNRELIPNSPSSSRQNERDLPSAFQWASTAYYPRPYDGPITLLLSEEVIESVENPSDQWRQLAPKTTVRPLPGSHLECITEHVETLAKEIQKCLREVGTGPSPAKKR